MSLPPHSRANVAPPGEREARPSLANDITGSCWDGEGQVLYVRTSLTGKGYIDAYRLQDGS